MSPLNRSFHVRCTDSTMESLAHVTEEVGFVYAGKGSISQLLEFLASHPTETIEFVANIKKCNKV
jgi:hypothetical protein